ncbi:MAG: M4 family metallopeptidase [Saprospiraceae bacterium]
MKKFFLLLLLTVSIVRLLPAQITTRQTLRFPQSTNVTLEGFLAGRFSQKFALPETGRLVLTRTETDLQGNRHFRLQQMHLGIPVFGGTAVLHEQNGRLSSGEGNLFQSLPASPLPVFSENDALNIATKSFPAEKYAWQIPAFEQQLKTATHDLAATFAPTGKLVFVPENLAMHEPGNMHLAWQFDLFAVEPNPARSLVFVDAQTGAPLSALPLMHEAHTPATGKARYVTNPIDFNTDSFVSGSDTVYRLRDLIRGIWVRDALNLLPPSNPNVDFVNNSTVWNLQEHETPVAALWGMEKWYDYMESNFNWQGFANDNSEMLCWVHFGNNYNNAFWNGNWVNFGDGNGIHFQPLVQLDIVAHECSHALIQNTCGLIYQGEPGALNEGLADIFAVLVERFAFPNGWNWKLGEAAYFDHANGLRRLDFPNTVNDPDTYDGQYWVNVDGCAPGITNDQCGIHSNCGVLGKFFYILAHGESGVNDLGTQYNIPGIGLDKAGEILLHSLHYLQPTDGFAEMRSATLNAAVDLFPGLENTVAEAWCAVGVGGCDLISSDSITLLSPNAFATYQHGQIIPVRWAATSGIQKLNLQISFNDGATWQLIQQDIDADTDSLDLPSPSVHSTLCRLRLSDAANPFVSDRTDTTFAITGCDLAAHFSTAVTTVCFGQPFYATNDSPNLTADFTWQLNGTDFPAPDALLEIPAMNIPGDNTVELIAHDAATGCRDTFRLIIKVLPQLTAQFSVEVHSTSLVANAQFQSADQYIWLLNGQQVGTNSPALTLNNVAMGTDSLRLIVVQNACPGGVAMMVTGVMVAAALQCVGGDTKFQQITYTNDIIDIAERGDKLYIAMPGCGAELDKNTHAFKIFKPENTNGVLSLTLTCVTVRQDGRVLFGTKSCGIAVYNPMDSSWEKIQSTGWLPSNRIVKMKTGDNGVTWVLTQFASNSNSQITRLDADGSVDYFPSFNSNVYSMQPIGEELWFTVNTTPQLNLKKTTPQLTFETVTNVVFPTNSTLKEISATAQKIWLTMTAPEKALVAIDRSNDSGTVFNASNSNLPTDLFSGQGIAADKLGGVWLDFGVLYFSGNGGSFSQPNIPAFNTVLPQVAFVDFSNTFWRGTRQGMVKYQNNLGEEINLSTNFENSITSSLIGSIRSVPGGNRVVVYQDGGYFEITNGKPEKIAPGCSATGTQFDIDSTGVIWGSVFPNKIGRVTFNGQCTLLTSLPSIPVLPSISRVKTWREYVIFVAGYKLLIYDPAANTTTIKDLYPSSTSWLSSDNSNSFWTWTLSDTLLEIKPNLSTHFQPAGVRVQYDYDYQIGFTVNQNGDMWFGVRKDFGFPTFSSEYKIYHRDPIGNVSQVQKLNSDFKESAIDLIQTDDAGSLWVGYRDKGLVKYDPVTDTYELFTDCDGLPSNWVNGIAFTPDGRVWVKTYKNGIGIITPSTDTIIASFSDPDVCQNAFAIFQNTTLGATTFEWRLDGILIATTKNLTYTFAIPGQHILTLIARNAAGCETAVSHVVEVHPQADLSALPTILANCDNSSQLEAPPGMYAYRWANALGITVGTTQKLPVTNGGLYTLTVTDHCGAMATKQITVLLADCVWPGDVNNDGIVDYRDWVLMTLVFGFTGPARDAQDITWQGHPALPWSGELPNNMNIKHADANGDGIIDLSDFEAIEVNYGKTHGAFPGLPDPQQSPLRFSVVLLQDSTDSNSRHHLTFGIVAESDSSSVAGFSAAGFELSWYLSYPFQFGEAPMLTFDGCPFGVEGGNMNSFYRKISDNTFHVGRCGTGHQNLLNTSLLAKVDYIVIDDIVGSTDTLSMNIAIGGAQALTSGGTFLLLGTKASTFTVGITDLQPLDDTGLLVFPNPSGGIFTAAFRSVRPDVAHFSVFDSQGRLVWQTTKAQISVEIDISEMPAGTYFLRAVTGGGIATKRLVKM